LPRTKKTDVYRNGKVHVLRRQCPTCIFFPGNRMDLEPGRVEGMVAQCERTQGCIPCHSTTFRQDPQGEAVCKGFFDRHATVPLIVADKLGYIEWQDLKTKDKR